MEHMELPSLLDEAKIHCNGDKRVEYLVEQILEFEKGYSFSYKGEIKEILEGSLGGCDEDN